MGYHYDLLICNQVFLSSSKIKTSSAIASAITSSITFKKCFFGSVSHL